MSMLPEQPEVSEKEILSWIKERIWIVAPSANCQTFLRHGKQIWIIKDSGQNSLCESDVDEKWAWFNAFNILIM
jgi:hypothetical protein